MGVPFEKLNKAQKQAVKIEGQRILILAGAGTGKTEVLSHRIRFLIKERNVDPSEILAITFTIKAAQEMFKRLREFPNFDPTGIRVLTIHGESWRILRQNLSEEISIADDDEATMVLKDAFEDLQFNKSVKVLKAIKEDIELSKANNRLPEDLENSPKNFLQIFHKYENLMKFNSSIDFGGILTSTNRLFKNDEILREVQAKTRYLLVDEYQDINQAQFEFIRYLSHSDSEVFCVGDDDQSIYSWRGAKPDFILNFLRDFPNAQELHLEETRRCPENILKAALNLISKIPETRRRPKRVYAYYKDGEPIYILKSSSELQEALWIAEWIVKEVSSGHLKPQEIAIVCRDIDLASGVVEVLKARNVSVEYWREGALFKDPVVKDIFAHLKVIIKPQNNLALRRCLLSSSVEDIGEKRVFDLRGKAQRLNKCIWDILPSVYGKSNTNKWQNNLSDFVKWMQELIKLSEERPVKVLIDKIIEKMDLTEENRYIGKLKILSQTSEMFTRDFLNEIIIKRRLDLMEGGPEPEEKEDAVVVMSMHSSKGLTFRAVFILGLEEEVFPRNNSNINDEERRLCYVAMTRAKQKLFLCTAKRRKGRAAKGIGFYDQPSQFLKDIFPCIAKEIYNYLAKKKASK